MSSDAASNLVLSLYRRRFLILIERISKCGQSRTFVNVINEIRLRRVNFIQITSDKRNIYFFERY